VNLSGKELDPVYEDIDYKAVEKNSDDPFKDVMTQIKAIGRRFTYLLN
jgi:hypothetical protein